MDTKFNWRNRHGSHDYDTLIDSSLQFLWKDIKHEFVNKQLLTVRKSSARKLRQIACPNVTLFATNGSLDVA